MLLEALRLVAALLLLVLLPGWLLVQALFPRRESLGFAARVYLTIAGGVLLLMSVGIALGFLPHGSRGHFSSFASGGMPNVELLTLAVSAGLFWAGAARGAYPTLAARYPRLVQPWVRDGPPGSRGRPQEPGS